MKGRHCPQLPHHLAGNTYIKKQIQIEVGEEGSGNWVTVVKHEDPEDESQMTSVVGFKSYATCSKTGNHIAYAEQYTVLYDTIHYENLEEGEEYVIISTLMDKDTQEIVHDGNGAEQVIETTFKVEERLDTGKYGSYGDIIPTNHDGDENNHDETGIIFKLNAAEFSGKTLVIFEELYRKSDMKIIASDMDFGNENQTIYFPKITTNAVTDETGTSVALAGDGTSIIKDTISYENVIPGLTYRIKERVIARKKTQETGTEVVATGTDGKPAVNSVDFTPSEANGSVQLSFDIDTSKYADGLKLYEGTVFVVYEELYVIQRYDDDESIVASHTDINDTNQTIYIPYITTTLLDTKTGLHIMYAENSAALTETISYYNFKPGDTFYVSGRLIDMKTGKVLSDSSNNEAKIEYQAVTAEGSGCGTWDLTYKIDASGLAGKTVVAYAEVYIQGGKGEGGYTQAAVHDDFYDAEERVYIPRIRTEAYDQDTVNHIAHADGSTYIIDKVFYDNIDPNKNYVLESELRWRNADGSDGGRVTDAAGKEQFLTTKFFADFDMTDEQYETYGVITPDNENGGIVFHLNTSGFDGKTVVVYERLYIEDDNGMKHLVADHQDISDKEQEIHFPKVWTSALDSETSAKTALADGMVTIVDTFQYENVLPGHTYELTGYLVDKNNTERVNADKVVYVKDTAGGSVTNTKRFYAEQASGTVQMQFSFDAKVYDSDEWKGMVLVVYEELYQVKRYDGADDVMKVAFETDVNNMAQTVWYPHIETELTDYDTKTHILSADKKAKVVDTVSYHNMQPNAAYTLSGRLINMETGAVLTDADGKRLEKTMEVRSTSNGDGSWDITYNFDASKMAGTIIVAYAEVYVKNGDDNTVLSPVAVHNEFWDLSERIYIPVISTVATDQKTNSHISFAENDMWITDLVYYSHLQPDSDYRLISTLVDKDTNEVVIDDKGISQRIETTFNTKPNSSQEKYLQTISNPFTDSSDTGTGYAYGYVVPGDGTTLPDGSKPDGIVFAFDGGTFEGRTLVVYEELQIYKADGTWATVATHMDINDENQTIHVPKIRTNAVDSETMTHLSKKDGSVTILDTITYENLIPGLTYTLEGCLMDKLRNDQKSGTEIKDANGHKITGSVTFTPKRPDGTETVTFQGNVKEFQTDEGEFSSETLVVFEDLYLLDSKDSSNDRLKIAEHNVPFPTCEIISSQSTLRYQL